MDQLTGSFDLAPSQPKEAAPPKAAKRQDALPESRQSDIAAQQAEFRGEQDDRPNEESRQSVNPAKQQDGKAEKRHNSNSSQEEEKSKQTLYLDSSVVESLEEHILRVRRSVGRRRGGPRINKSTFVEAALQLAFKDISQIMEILSKR